MSWLLTSSLLVTASLAALLATPAFAEPTIDFDRDIRPILSNHCYQCHGPDGNHREADLRFDVEESAIAELESGERAIVPHDPQSSELVARIYETDESVLMPPPETLKPLSDEQKALLVRWIEDGAPFAEHWSLVPPTKHQPPTPPNGVRVGNEIDAFITARYPAASLTQRPVANKRTLLRRLTFDLTGLPPTPEQLAAFEADLSPDAYENAVDRLLASPHYGEHMTRYWLDLVRYADTHGMHFDNYREMWPYRDWVIESFNANKPYSDFITEQLAGDLFPDPTREQLIASGFNRLNLTTNEGGSIYEEVFVRNVVDRTEAFGTVFLGLTTGCAVCHDHKFDPISQKDFYSLYAYFNSLDGRALDGNSKDHAPALSVPRDTDLEQLASLQAAAQNAWQAVDVADDQLDADQAAWEQSLRDSGRVTLARSETVPLRPLSTSSQGESVLHVEADHVIDITGPTPAQDTYEVIADLPSGRYTGLKLDVFANAEHVNGRIGRSHNGNAVISEVELAVSQPNSEKFIPVKFTDAKATYAQGGKNFAVTKAIDGKVTRQEGWALGGHEKEGDRVAVFATEAPFGSSDGSRVRVRIRHDSQWEGHAIGRFAVSATSNEPFVQFQAELGPWHIVGPFPGQNLSDLVRQKLPTQGDNKFQPGREVQHKGQTFTWSERLDLTDGLTHELPTVGDVSATLLYRKVTVPTDQALTVLADTTDGMEIYLNGKLVKPTRISQQRSFTPLTTPHKLNLKAGDNHVYLKVAHASPGQPSQFSFAVRDAKTLPTGRLAEIVNTPSAERSSEQASELRSFYRRVVATSKTASQRQNTATKATQKALEFYRNLPTTLIFKELPQPREAHILVRGEYDNKGDVVPRATPEALPAMNPAWPQNRLGLAHWLLDESHPLTARVAVNRFWQQVFGTGLVKTSEDFGAQGEPPSHPKLLDWLAVDFQEHGWDVRRLMKQLVMSETYRQASDLTPELIAADPNNRLLARGPRHRLDAEALRDQALFVAGLLNSEIGGPSVKPPQPLGLWKAVGYSRSNTANFKPSAGDDIYRRSVYIFWKRSAHAPMMATLDAPTRESCTARRERTNTPLQALLLMNEQMYVESAKKLAERVLVEFPNEDTSGRLAEMFLSATGRQPTAAEQDVLSSLLADAMTSFQQRPDAAKELLSIGVAGVNESIDAATLAGWTIVANTILNLDETVTKN